MKKWLIAAVTAVLCVVALGAYTYSYTPLMNGLKPSLTGDPASDATCAAAVMPFIEDGEPQAGKLIGMTLEERQDMATAVEKASRDVALPDIKQAATGVLGGLAISGEGTGLFGSMGFMMSIGKLAEACTNHGWDAKKAGLW